MRIRDLGVWLVPLALVAREVPQLGISNHPEETALLAQAEPSPSDAISASDSSPRPSSIGGESLEHYSDDACHLLWRFVETNRRLAEPESEVKIAVREKDQKGEVSLNEEIKGSQQPELAPRCDLKDEQFAKDLRQ